MFKKIQHYFIISVVVFFLCGSCAAHKYKNHQKPCDCENVKANPRVNKHK